MAYPDKVVSGNGEEKMAAAGRAKWNPHSSKWSVVHCLRGRMLPVTIASIAGLGFLCVRYQVERAFPFEPWNRPVSKMRFMLEYPFDVVAVLLQKAVLGVFGPGVRWQGRDMNWPLVLLESVCVAFVTYIAARLLVAWRKRRALSTGHERCG